jgi:hypothetical protein
MTRVTTSFRAAPSGCPSTATRADAIAVRRRNLVGGGRSALRAPLG